MLDAGRDDLSLGIVGSGLMGRGIAQVAALAGVQVTLFDARPQAAEVARQAVGQVLAMRVGKGKLSADQAEGALGRIRIAGALRELAPVHLVIEAITEDLDAKRGLFQALEAVVGESCVLATNTSSLSVTAIAAACRAPQRVGGLHFFSPVPLMKIVEVVDGARSAPWVGEALCALAQRLGHTPVRAKDTPGFIVNHAGRAYVTEALRIVDEGVADFAAVDRVLRGQGFRLGPFELLDLTGLDVSFPVMTSLYDAYFQEPRFRPSPTARQRLAAGLLGRKSGQGFYAYLDGQAQRPAPPEPPPALRPEDQPALWVSRRDAEARSRLASRLEAAGVVLDGAERPGPDSVCVVLPWGDDATTSALDEGLEPERTVAVDPLARAPTLMTNPASSARTRDAAWRALAAPGDPVTVIRDGGGFIAQRVLAMIVNVGCELVQQRIATPDDLDCAVKRALAYPEGPLALGDALGPPLVLRILERMHALYRDPRYRPSPWLLRRARLGLSLRTPEP
jgi:3-hydroxybutyryl-CoA dehydrogenase